MNSAFFSLIQFCADIARQEYTNVGVAVVCPETGFTRVRYGIGPVARKMLSLHGFRQEGLQAILGGFVSRLELQLEQAPLAATMRTFETTGTNPVRLSEPRQMMLRRPDEDFDVLFDRLVHGSTKSSDRKPSVRRELYDAFSQREVSKYLESGVVVHVPSLHSQLRVPYAYRNGRLNLLEPTNFDNLNRSRVEQVASRLAIAGKSLAEDNQDRTQEARLVVIGRMGSRQEGEEDFLRDLFASNETQFYTMDDRGLDLLADKIRADIHH